MTTRQLLHRGILIVALALTSACGSRAGNELSPEAAYAAYQAGPVTMLDVRTDEEWNAGHVKGAVHVPVDRVAEQARQALPELDQPIVVYCKSGGRASRAGKTLAELGYTNVRVLTDGGYPDWQAAGHPVER